MKNHQLRKPRIDTTKRATSPRRRLVASLSASLLALVLLVPVQLKVRPPLLMAERFLPGAGWIEIALLAGYAALLARLLLNPARVARVRAISWTLFSLVFFGQLLLGLLVSKTFLMTGRLHLPVPGMVPAGVIYHGRLFMVLLFTSTVLLVGPAWCSYLCYLGSWDLLAAKRKRRRPKTLPDRGHWRWATLILVVATAAILRWIGLGWRWAGLLGGLFGLVGLAWILSWSPKQGMMTHCVWYCPLGLLAVLLGRLSPHRIRIDPATCTDCGACTFSCRYGALERKDIEARKPGSSCTLCGDCLASCPHGAIGYRFAGLKPALSHSIFVVTVAALQAVFLGLARI